MPGPQRLASAAPRVPGWHAAGAISAPGARPRAPARREAC